VFRPGPICEDNPGLKSETWANHSTIRPRNLGRGPIDTPVEMAKGRGALPEREVSEREPFSPPRMGRQESHLLAVDEASSHSNGDRVGAIICGQFGKDALHVALDGGFRDIQAAGDDFVGVSHGYSPQNLDFAFC
jgi:hypothetical protein